MSIFSRSPLAKKRRAYPVPLLLSFSASSIPRSGTVPCSLLRQCRELPDLTHGVKVRARVSLQKARSARLAWQVTSSVRSIQTLTRRAMSGCASGPQSRINARRTRSAGAKLHRQTSPTEPYERKGGPQVDGKRATRTKLDAGVKRPRSRVLRSYSPYRLLLSRAIKYTSTPAWAGEASPPRGLAHRRLVTRAPSTSRTKTRYY